MLVQDVQIKSGQQTKQLHSAPPMARRRKCCKRPSERRMNLHSAWRGFLTESAKQWQKYTDLFLQRETTFRQGEHCQGRSGFCQGSSQFLKDRSRCRVQGRCIQSERHRRLGREHDQYFGMRRSS